MFGQLAGLDSEAEAAQGKLRLGQVHRVQVILGDKLTSSAMADRRETLNNPNKPVAATAD
ncbi:MAG: hypothetical protein HC805_07740 [Alkalinema sp. RL_2_19]|nr:hypothetical protein [Alkalinema sp. RL_2_19]